MRIQGSWLWRILLLEVSPFLVLACSPWLSAPDSGMGLLDWEHSILVCPSPVAGRVSWHNSKKFFWLSSCVWSCCLVDLSLVCVFFNFLSWNEWCLLFLLHLLLYSKHCTSECIPFYMHPAQSTWECPLPTVNWDLCFWSNIYFCIHRSSQLPLELQQMFERLFSRSQGEVYDHRMGCLLLLNEASWSRNVTPWSA